MNARTRWRARSLGCFVAPALLIVACAAPQRPRNAAYVDRLCNTICEKRVQCDPKWDVAICQKTCRERGSRARGFWRDDYANATLACIDNASCDVITNLPLTEKRCFKETRPEPTPLAKRFCEVATERDRACTGMPPNMPRCLRTWGLINEDVLKDALECQDRPCGKAGRCAKAFLQFEDDDN